MKLNNKQLTEYILKCEEIREEYPQWRKGQTYFNVLYDMYPEIAEEIRATAYDPFHVDTVIPYFLNHITES